MPLPTIEKVAISAALLLVSPVPPVVLGFNHEEWTRVAPFILDSAKSGNAWLNY